MKNNKGIASILIFLIVAGVLALGGGTYYFFIKKTQKPVGCTQEAKTCPDGSSIGRTGPNCEFAACPTVKTDETADWKTYIRSKMPAFGEKKIALILFEPKGMFPFKINYGDNSFTLFDLFDNKEEVKIFPKNSQLKVITEDGKQADLDLPVDVYFHSVYFLNTWFSRETKRLLNEPNFISFKVQVYGPYDDIIGLPYTSVTYNQDLAKLNRDFLKDKTIEQGVDIDSFDAVLYIYFDIPTNLSNGFRSQAFRCDKDALIEFQNNYNAYQQEIVSIFHELFHLLGADDHYEGYKCLQVPAVYAECIMCPGSQIDRQEICQEEAEEMGWQDKNKNGILDVKENNFFYCN